MKYKFTTQNFDIKDLQKPELSGINPYLLENNIKQIEQIYDFLSSNSSLLLINGFMGTGKSALVSHVLKATDCIAIKYRCFETTILDDILLAFFNDFKILTEQGKITPPKNKLENFAQKINAYFELNNRPMLILIDSFEEILKNNSIAIIDFIKHLCSLPNIKVLITSRKFDYEDFDFEYSKIAILALEKTIFEKYLRSQNFKQIGPFSDELYKHTRGYFFYTTLALQTMQMKNINLIKFLDAYSKSFLTFNDYILREAMSFIDPVSGHLFRFLTTMRHPVSINLLKSLQLYNEERVEFFINNLILSKYKNYLYLRDYYKPIAENSIPKNVSIKLHQGCVDLYNTQLPLKPLERDLLISRQTMRNEIEYHSTFIPQKIVIEAEKFTVTEQKNVEVETPPIEIVEMPKEEQIKKMSFIFEDDETGVLDKIATTIKGFIDDTKQRVEEEKIENKFSLTELMNFAKKEEENFDYKHAISLYQKALTLKNNDDYYTYLPTIYTKLAFDYQNCSNWYDAQKYFELATEFYNSTGDIEKYNEMQYNIANIYYMTFKRDKAKEILTQIEKQTISDELRIKVYNSLANITTNSNECYEYYQKALEIKTNNIDKSVLSELYYKYALINEDRGDDKTALIYYKKCIDLKNSSYLALALTNLATLYDDLGERSLAIKYYFESLKIDEDNKNLNGMYTTSMKLAEIYSAQDTVKTLEYYSKALEYAYELKEAFYIISASIAIGDFYFNHNENSSAYKNYKIALELAQNSVYKDNIEKIEIRINDIKLRIGEERFNELAK